MGGTGRTAGGGAPAPVKAVEGEGPLAGAWAAKARGKSGHGAHTAVPALVQALHDDELLVRAWAAEALRRIQRRR